MTRPTARFCLSALLAAMLPIAAQAQDQTSLNLYSARHYQTDQALYDGFTRATGIPVKLIEGSDAALLERLASEGKNSPADVLLLADASRLWKAEQEGVFARIRSPELEKRIPANLRGASNEQGTAWFGFSTRARVIIYNKAEIDPALVQNYADLARPELKGRLCTRSGFHPYMLSLIGSRMVHEGEAATQAWANAAVENFARKPRGGDTDQIKAVAIGECGVALSNSYYYVRLMRSDKPEDQAVITATGLIWPDQNGVGTHVNVSGGGVVATAPHKQAARKFIEYLASDEAQKHFAEGNNEWPAVPDVGIDNPALTGLGDFKVDPLPLSKVGAAQADALKLIDRAGWR
ncbi:MAG: extracellular solute-binding protein [Burkholderiaceae bacterium]